jgi:predicted RNase H-like HicB family nuclease
LKLIVCDTGPLLHLREAGALDLLEGAGQIVIPPAVQTELIDHDPFWDESRPTWIYQVQADWDPEAGVWVATSDDVPGLATEAPTVEALTEKLRTMIPELLEANQLESASD